MLIAGFDSMSPHLNMAMVDALPSPIMPSVTPTGTVRRKVDDAPREATLIGELDLVGGRAYISGVAEEVFGTYTGDRDRRAGM